MTSSFSDDENLVLDSSTTLRLGKDIYRCSIGRGGVKKHKKEGDGATPVGEFSLEKVFYRADRVGLPLTGLPVEPITEQMGWCDDPKSSFYNKLISLPFEPSHEKLWRDDSVYNLIIIVGYNINPTYSGQGSAIFIHLAREGYTPTEGCIALNKEDLEKILGHLTKETKLIVPSFS